MAFETFPAPMHMRSSKSISNFTGTAHRMHVQGLWDYSNCRCCFNPTESETDHALYCTNANLAAMRENLIEKFVFDANKLDWNQDSMQMLIQYFLDNIYTPLPHLVHLSTCINQCSHRALCHGISLQAFLESVHNDFLSMHKILSKIIK